MKVIKTLRTYQKECIDIINNLESGAYLIRLATALGKCFAKGTKILMYDGTCKNVEDIKDGDNIMGVDGKSRIVVGCTNGIENMYEIKFNDGKTFTVNESHILALTTANLKKHITDNKGRNYSSWTKINMSVKDYVESPNRFKKGVYSYRAPVDFKEKPIVVNPYLFGCWIATQTKGVYDVCIRSHEAANEIFGYCEAVGIKSIKRCEAEPVYTMVSNTISGHNPLSYYVSTMNLFSRDKIPDDYLYNTFEIRKQVLAGIIDTIGEDRSNTGEYLCTSRNAGFTRDLLILCRGLGLTAYSTNVDDEELHHIYIGGAVGIIPSKLFSSRGKRKNIIPTDLLSGFSVQPVGESEYYGFEVLGEDRLFLLDDFSVVHNTVIFTHIERKGRVLVLAHREELIYQPAEYYDCPVGIEMSSQTSNGEPVVIASVQSLVRRLNKFNPDDFDTIICDEAHHSAAPTYRKILNYFKPRLLLGFTATPKRGDKVRLDDIYKKIIYDRNVKWGIVNRYLPSIQCMRINVGYDISNVRRKAGDFVLNELEQAVNITKANKAIADVYKKYATGQTLIFATTIKHAFAIQKEIHGSCVITGETENRKELLDKFKEGRIKCLINVNVFTEGTDIPNIKTVIIARPTQSETLYTQMVGRGLRLARDKQELLLIDCVGVSGKLDLCSAPTLFGLSLKMVPEDKISSISGDIMELEDKINKESDVPESWIKNIQLVDLWSKEREYDTHHVNWYILPNNNFILHLPNNEYIMLDAPDELGNTIYEGKEMKMQEAFDEVYEYLCANKKDAEMIWNLEKVKHWANDKATEKQKILIKKIMPGFNTKKLSKFEASQVLNRLMSGKHIKPKEEKYNEEQSIEKHQTRIMTYEEVLQSQPKDYVAVFMNTTGSDYNKDEIYRLTAIKYRNLQKVDEFDTFIYVSSEKIRDIYRKNGIDTPWDLPRVNDAMKMLDEFTEDLPLIGHKVGYALIFLEKNGYKIKPVPCIDTFALAKNKYTTFTDWSLEILESMLLLKREKCVNYNISRLSLLNEFMIKFYYD